MPFGGIALQQTDVRPRRAAGLADATDGLREAVAVEIDRHHADPGFGVAALAQRLGFHRSHLTRRLDELGAPPPARQLRARRVAAAQVLLAAGASVAAAAAGSGFAGPDQLTRAFRAELGATPTAWLQRGRGLG